MAENFDKALSRSEEDIRREEIQKKNEMAKRFPQAIRENQIEEVNALIQKDFKKDYRCLTFPSTEMARILINDMKRAMKYDDVYNRAAEMAIENTIKAHPEDAAKWDDFAKKHNISYNFKTMDREVFDKVVEQGFDVKCYDFDNVVDTYYEAKNGYVERKWYGPYKEFAGVYWENADPQKAAQIKEDLVYVLSKGYKVDLFEKDSKSDLFMQELQQDREHQKQRGDKSFVYRAPSEEFYDVTTGQCKLSWSKLELITKTHGDDRYRGGKEPDSIAIGTINNGKFTGRIYNVTIYDVRGNFLIRPHFLQYKDGWLKGVHEFTDKERSLLDNNEVDRETYNASKRAEDEERKNFIRKKSMYNVHYTGDNAAESKATAVIGGIAGLVVATVSVATYMNSSYSNKEKAPEDKKVAPQEIKFSQLKLNKNEIRMFQLALTAPTAEFKAFMDYHKDININAANENGETVLMLALANDKLKNAEYILEKFGDKIEYKARTNDGIGYQDIMKARLHSPTATGQDIKIDRTIKANTKKEDQQIKEGKARSTDSYAFYDLMKGKTKE